MIILDLWIFGGGIFHGTSITKNHLFNAWRDFKKGKEKRVDVTEFTEYSEVYLHELWSEIISGTYKHCEYTTFKIADPKLRTINKACVRDRIVHQMIHTELEKIFDKKFIHDSYSSRKNKGVHRAVDRFEYSARKVSWNNRRTVYVLKCDIKKFFDSVNHKILMNRVSEYIIDPLILSLFQGTLESFTTLKGTGIPLGNLTSQISANMYMDIFDQYIKRGLGIKYYLRYADDFIILADNKTKLYEYLNHIKIFLYEKLQLQLHPHKVEMRTWRQGVDVLGYVSYPTHRVLRTKTKQRIRKDIKKLKYLLEQNIISQERYNQSIASYKGRIHHCWSQQLERYLGLGQDR